MGKKKGIGFTGQRIIQIPRQIAEKCKKLPLVDRLYITKMGMYPKALNHYYQRPKGMGQAVLLYCSDGRGWVQINNRKVIVKSGEVYIIPQGVAHSYGSDDTMPWTIYWFHLNGPNCDALVSAVMGKTPESPVYAGSGESRIELFDKIEQTFLNGYSTENLIFANLTLSFFISSFIIPEYFEQAESMAKISHIEKAIKYMQENLSQPGNLSVIAASAHLSVSFFSKHFKQETGYSPIEYFNYLKIQKACHLLHSGNLRINEVSRTLGISDQLYFSRLFKKVMGVSPVVYRKSELGVNKNSSG